MNFPVFNFDADSDPDPAPTPSFTHVGKSLFSFIHSSAGLRCFIFLVSVIGVIIFSNLEIKFVIFCEKYCLIFDLVEVVMDRESDPPKKADPTGSGFTTLEETQVSEIGVYGTFMETLLGKYLLLLSRQAAPSRVCRV
jgi:hypothetical protein